jgi:hypothetical protein
MAGSTDGSHIRAGDCTAVQLDLGTLLRIVLTCCHTLYLYGKSRLFRLGHAREGARLWPVQLAACAPDYDEGMSWTNRKPPPDVAITKPCNCLECGKLINALGTGDRRIAARPSPGDLMACIGCGAVMMLADDLTMRGMTEEEIDDVMANVEAMNDLARAVRGIHLLKMKRAN